MRPICVLRAYAFEEDTDLAGSHVLEVHSHLAGDSLAETQVGSSNLNHALQSQGARLENMLRTSNAYSFSTGSESTGVAYFLICWRA